MKSFDELISNTDIVITCDKDVLDYIFRDEFLIIQSSEFISQFNLYQNDILNKVDCFRSFVFINKYHKIAIKSINRSYSVIYTITKKGFKYLYKWDESFDTEKFFNEYYYNPNIPIKEIAAHHIYIAHNVFTYYVMNTGIVTTTNKLFNTTENKIDFSCLKKKPCDVVYLKADYHKYSHYYKLNYYQLFDNSHNEHSEC